MKLYWYAPFNNGGEHDLAVGVPRPGDELVVQAVRSRFGRELPTDGKTFRFLRDLPGIAGEDGGRARPVDRARLALERASLRHRAVVSGDFDLCHVHSVNPFTDGFALRLLRKRDRPLFVSVHNVRPHKRLLPGPAETIALGAAYRAGNHLIVAHDHLRARLMHEFGIDENRISTLPFPVVTAADSSALRQDDESPLVLFFGTLRENKGLPVLLSAIEMLVGRTDARFHIAGRGEAPLEDMVRRASEHIANVVCEIGYVEPGRQADLYRRATLLVLPYTSLPAQSGVLQDAYGYALPVVAADVGALGAAVREEGVGWVVRPNDAEALASGILDALNDSVGREEARKAMARIAAERSPEALGSRLRALYGELA